MTLGHVGCRVRRKTQQIERQTEMDGPIRRSLLTLEREERLKVQIKIYKAVLVTLDLAP
jgi:hypothetical protein